MMKSHYTVEGDLVKAEVSAFWKFVCTCCWCLKYCGQVFGIFEKVLFGNRILQYLSSLVPRYLSTRNMIFENLRGYIVEKKS